jgi:hypothetical protein
MDEDSDLDQEFMNAMCGNDDIDNNDSSSENSENSSNCANSIEKSATSRNFLEIFGEDILIRICSTLSASHLCDFAKACRWQVY